MQRIETTESIDAEFFHRIGLGSKGLLWRLAPLEDRMHHDVAFMRLRLRELEGRIHARRQLAGQAPERQWHLTYVEIYEAEMQQLQVRLQNPGLTSSPSNLPQVTTPV